MGRLINSIFKIKTIYLALFIGTFLISFFILLTIYIDKRPRSAPERLNSIPQSAIWKGGNKGGYWYELVDVQDSNYHFRIYDDVTGDVIFDAGYIINGFCFEQLKKENVMNHIKYWNDDEIYLDLVSNKQYCIMKMDYDYLSKNCNSENKTEELVKDILHKRYIYAFVDEKYKYIYLAANDFIKPGKIYNVFDSIKVISTQADSMNKGYRRIYFNKVNFNKDSTKFNVEVEYMTYIRQVGDNRPKLFPTKISRFTYILNTKNCIWELKDYKTDFFR